MRSEQEIMDLILNIANSDERIRAVYMNGSRTNPNAPKDRYQDYDIVFVVTETSSFLADKSWISVFGTPLIIQEPDWNDFYAGIEGQQYDFERRYAWLMLFNDGNRIDLAIEIKEESIKNFIEDKLTILLLDKDNFLPIIFQPSDEDYHIKKPTENRYYACCNDFWWCLNNVAKGIARDELSYVMHMLNNAVRSELHVMMNYYIGSQHGFNLSTGKEGKYFKKYLSPELYMQYAATYSGSDYTDVWKSIDVICDLFHTLAISVAAHFGFSYRQNEETGIREYFKMVKAFIIMASSYFL
ncbi:MAG: aminoglycoside 6-adenylyltransferase [Eubacteriales bacterium]